MSSIIAPWGLLGASELVFFVPATTVAACPENAAAAALASAGLQGHSIGGQETCSILPTLRLAFDSGRCPQRVVYQETLCLSHGHLDHAGGLHCYAATRAMLSLRPPDVLCPPPIEAAVKRMLASWGELDGADIKADVRGGAPGDE